MNITKEQTNIFKGIAIVIITLHNYLNMLPPKLGVNEFHFNPQLLISYFEYSLINPTEVLTLLFSYFGHYGVAVFIFLSAYGITASLDKKIPPYINFITKRFYKIYLPFLLIVFLFLALAFAKSMLQGEPELLWYKPTNDVLESILYKILLISNFIPDEAFKPIGPWWFVSFIFQFYLIFYLIYKVYLNFGNVFLLGLGILGMILENIFWHHFSSININYTVFGHLPIICFGLYCRKNTVNINIFLYPSILLFILGNFIEFLWPLSGLAFTILFLALFIPLTKKKSKLSLFNVFGKYSLYIFLLNGFIRHILYSVSFKLDIPIVSLNHFFYACMCLVVCAVFAVILTRLENLFIKALER